MREKHYIEKSALGWKVTCTQGHEAEPFENWAATRSGAWSIGRDHAISAHQRSWATSPANDESYCMVMEPKMSGYKVTCICGELRTTAKDAGDANILWSNHANRTKDHEPRPG